MFLNSLNFTFSPNQILRKIDITINVENLKLRIINGLSFSFVHFHSDTAVLSIKIKSTIQLLF